MIFLPQIAENFTHNAVLKSYPDGTSRLIVSDKAIFREPGWEPVKRGKKGKGDLAALQTWLALSEEDDYIRDEWVGKMMDNDDPFLRHPERESMRRARSRLRDIARSTRFKWFVTLTLDERKMDRYWVEEIVDKLKTWLDNRVRRYGLSYVLVPELHKDGAVHFHGFFNDALDRWMVDSGHLDSRGNRVFNCEAWTYGFTTAVELYGDYSAAVAYVCKYIGKQEEKIGGRWYYSGGKLGRPSVKRFTLDEPPEGGYEFVIGAIGARCRVFDIGADGTIKEPPGSKK